MRKTYLYRAKLNKQTEANVCKWLNVCRTLYNLALEQRITVHRHKRKSLGGYTQMYDLPALKKEFPEFAQVDAQTLQNVIKRLNRTYGAFFRRLRTNNGKAGFPRFKGKHRYHSFTLEQTGWKLEGRNLYIRNVGRFKLFLSRPIQGRIKTITIKRTTTGKWFVAFSCDNVSVKEYPETTASVGIDVGTKHFLMDSAGHAVENPQYFRQSEKLLRRRQRSLARKKRGSKKRQRARLLVAKAHEKVANQRKDFLHKLSTDYVRNFASIYIEDLNISGMVKNRHLSKSIIDSSWATFFELLSYKAVEAGRELVKVNPKGTSQVCSNCGEKVPKSLSVRVHRCPYCGLEIDRDLNAALNIEAVGHTVQAQTSALAGVVCEPLK